MYKSSDFTKPVYKTGEIMEILNILTFQSKFQFIWNLIRKTLSKRPTGIYSEKHDRDTSLFKVISSSSGILSEISLFKVNQMSYLGFTLANVHLTSASNLLWQTGFCMGYNAADPAVLLIQ